MNDDQNLMVIKETHKNGNNYLENFTRGIIKFNYYTKILTKLVKIMKKNELFHKDFRQNIIFRRMQNKSAAQKIQVT